jgi:ubiquinone/menaquinone biosynthesis C-methylase UbiE
MTKTDPKKISEHYTSQAKLYNISPKSTMKDQFIRALEVSKLRETLTKLSNKNTKVLEVGCGNGYTVSKLSKKLECNFVCIDANKEMIQLASKRKLKKIVFSKQSILEPTFRSGTFDIVFTQRCLINLTSWKSQKIALNQIHRLLKKDGFLVLLEAFDDGLKELNQARRIIGLEKISPAWHNLHLNKSKLHDFIQKKFVNGDSKSKQLTYDNFLSSYYFGSRILYPGLLEKKSRIKYNNKFVEFFSLMPPLGNYSPLQLIILKKR